VLKHLNVHIYLVSIVYRYYNQLISRSHQFHNNYPFPLTSKSGLFKQNQNNQQATPGRPRADPPQTAALRRSKKREHRQNKPKQSNPTMGVHLRCGHVLFHRTGLIHALPGRSETSRVRLIFADIYERRISCGLSSWPWHVSCSQRRFRSDENPGAEAGKVTAGLADNNDRR